MKHTTIPSLTAIRNNKKNISSINSTYQENLNPMDKAALWITNKVGSMGFFLLIFSWTVVWLSWNTLANPSLRFDPYPAFVLWLFISNMIQISLMPLIMIGQNLQSKHAELLAEQDFEINKKAENEIEIILMHLENQNELITKLLQKIENLENR